MPLDPLLDRLWMYSSYLPGGWAIGGRVPGFYVDDNGELMILEQIDAKGQIIQTTSINDEVSLWSADYFVDRTNLMPYHEA